MARISDFGTGFEVYSAREFYFGGRMNYGIDRKFQSLLPLLVVGIVFIIFTAQPLFGQTASRIEEELNATDKVIERATDLVEESGNAQAEQYLEKANHLQGIAKENMSGNPEGRSALRFTLQARTHAEKAITIVRSGGENQDFVQRELERTQEILKQAQEYFDLAQLDRTLTIYEQAQTAQSKAEELFTQNQQKMALASTLRAREILETGLESARLSRQAEKELERTGMLIDRAKEMLREMNMNEFPAEFKNGVKYYEEAGELYDRGQFKNSYENTIKAREMILNTIERAEQNAQEENFPKVISQLQERYTSTFETIRASGSSQAQKILERAGSEIQQAEESYQKGNIKQGMFHLRRANRFIGQATEIVSQ